MSHVTSFSYFSRGPIERDIGLTDTNGIIVLQKLSSADTVSFCASDHRGAIAGFHGHNQVGIVPNPPENVDTMWREQTVVKKDPIVIIPLQRKE